MLAVILLAYGVISAFFAPNLLIFKVSWRFDPSGNRSTAYLVKNPAVDSMLPVISGVLFTVKPVSILLVIICSSVSIDRLKRATTERRAMRESHAVSQSKRKVTKMMLFLYITYVVCFIPHVAGAFATHFVSEFFFYTKFHNIFVVYFQGVVVFSCLNSTVNVFAYLALSSRIWATLVGMIPCFSRLFAVRWRSDRKPDETSGAVTQFQIMTLSAE